MSKIYRSGPESRYYHRLSRAERAAVASEVDRRFREQTGVAGGLNRTSSKDLEFRRAWLRIRDAVMAEKMTEEDMDLHRDLLIGPDFPGEIAEEMYQNHWKEAGELLETWAGRPSAVAKNYSAPVTHIIKMDWVLGFDRAKEVYDKIIADRIWTNTKSVERIVELLRKRPRVWGDSFGDLNGPVTVVDEEWVNARPVELGLGFDPMAVALGAFELQVAIGAKVLSSNTGEFQLSVQEVGIYVKDSWDFNGSQFLGFWGYRDDPIRNEDFQKWRAENNAGGDFQVFSDVKRTRLTTPDVVTGKL